MTKLNCPFCGEKIEHIEDGWCNCKNRCTGSGSIELWLQFIRTRKALDVAVDALNKCHETFTESEALIVANKHNRIANRAIAEITALEQKDIK